MSSISAATSQAFTPVAQAPVKPDVTVQQTPAKPVVAASSTPKLELPSTRNSDGTYGPNHLKTKPGTIPVSQPATPGSINIHA
jgi:hypothetical protein